LNQTCRPPTKGRVLEIGSGDNPHPRADVLVDRYLRDNTERHGDLCVDRPLVVADAHYLPFQNGVFAYSICSHILEHLDHPQQFARELERVSKAGYIGCPSEIAERLFHWAFHRWYVNLVGQTLVLYPKEETEPFGELFDYLYEHNPAYHFFQRSMPDLFWVEKEWQTTLNLRVTGNSPLLLNDPVVLRQIVQPKFSLWQLMGIFLTSMVTRIFPFNIRHLLRRFLKRSYL